MADLFSVTAPLAIRFPNGEKQVVIKCFPSSGGLIIVVPYWDRQPTHEAFRFVSGPVKGDGPWKVGDAVMTVLGCHGTDAELAGEFANWKNYREQRGEACPDDATLRELALRFRQQSPSA